MTRIALSEDFSSQRSPDGGEHTPTTIDNRFVHPPTKSDYQEELRKTLESMRFYECTLMRDPEGGWWVAPDGGDSTFNTSMTRHAEDLEQAEMFASQIFRKRTNY